MPLPLAMMIPFMGIQSAVMAKQFGENFQFGKRRISAMSNDEFNKLTPKIIMSNANTELSAMIPDMKQSITMMNEFQHFLILEFIKMIKDLVVSMPAAVLQLLGIDPALIEQFSSFVGGGDTGTPPSPPPDGEETDEGIVLTIEQIQGMTFQQLSFETQPNQITKYSPSTQNHMQVELINKQREDQETRITNPLDWTDIAEFLVALAAITDFLPYKNLPWFTAQFGAVNGPRNPTTESNAVLLKLQEGAKARRILYDREVVATGNTGEANKYFTGYKTWATNHWFHQLIYSL